MKWGTAGARGAKSLTPRTEVLTCFVGFLMPAQVGRSGDGAVSHLSACGGDGNTSHSSRSEEERERAPSRQKPSCYDFRVPSTAVPHPGAPRDRSHGRVSSCDSWSAARADRASVTSDRQTATTPPLHPHYAAKHPLLFPPRDASTPSSPGHPAISLPLLWGLPRGERTVTMVLVRLVVRGMVSRLGHFAKSLAFVGKTRKGRR